MLTVTLVGRPNVGKSTLFNRLVGKKQAIVENTPGVTRDRREGMAKLGDAVFKVVDTAGLEDVKQDSLLKRMRQQSEQAIHDADVVVFMIDGRAGLTPLDGHFADFIRKQKKTVILVVNKAESAAALAGVHESFKLGLGEPLAISAEHNQGIGELLSLLSAHLPPEEDDDDEDEKDKPIELAIIGRPNVGKSTLLNALLDEDRVLTGPEAGITRDAIKVPFQYKDQAFHLIDTAGMRKKARVSHAIEKLSVADAKHAIQFAQIVVLLLDATLAFEKQDLTIAHHVIEEGRGLVIAVNKWDLVKNKKVFLEHLQEQLAVTLPQVKKVPIITISALNKKNLESVLDKSLEVYEVWNRRFSTPHLNGWLEEVIAAHPPPVVSGRRIKFRYMTQANTRPPTFAIFCNMSKSVPRSYKQYLLNAMREHLDLPATPLRLMFRGGKNPYNDKK